MVTKPGEPLGWIKRNVPFATDDCVTWPYARFADGYGAVRIDGRAFRVHRVICTMTNGEPPPAHDAAHSCGNGHLGCVNNRHLRWASRGENIADAIRHGSWGVGQRGANAKLTDDQAVAILALRGSGRLQKDVAKEFGVSRELVGRIWRRQVWSWLP